MPMPPVANDGTFLAPPTFYMPLRLTGLDERTLTPDPEEAAPCSRILIVWSGSGILRVNDAEYEIGRGSVYLSTAATRFKLKLNPLTPLRGIQLEYRCLTADGSRPSGMAYPLPLQRCSAGIMRLAGELEKVWREPQLGGPFRVQQLFIELIAELDKEVAARQQPVNSWIEQALQYMEAHYHQDLTREQMAQLANVSPEHFSRMFRRHTGRTFNAHLTLLRIRSAQLRMMTGAPDLHTLAQEVGYKEGFYLSRKFKESVGLSPTAYLRKRKRIAALNSNHTASLMALGIVPELGIYTPWLEHEQSRRKLSIGQKLNAYGHSSSAYYEAVAAAHPDVIISYSAAEENKSLMAVAPVLELPFMTMSWREQFRLIADIAGRQRQAEDRLLQYDELLGSMNAWLDRELGRHRGTAIVWEIAPTTAYCFSSSYGRGCQILYEDIGFRPPSRLLEQGIMSHGYLEAEIEAIASYPADHIFITGIPSGPDTELRIQRLFHTPEWMNLESVRRNRVYLLNEPDLFYGSDPISSQAQLSELLRVMTADHK